MDGTPAKLKVVYAVADHGDKKRWSRVGLAWERADGVVFARLDALPVSGQLCIKDWSPADGQEGDHDSK